MFGRALREAFEEDRRRQLWELHGQIQRRYGIRSGDAFKAYLWWGWAYTVDQPGWWVND